MKSKLKILQKANLGTPGDPATKAALGKFLLKAEKGNFLSLPEFKRKLEEWRNKKK